jgi:hypothetical protein
MNIQEIDITFLAYIGENEPEAGAMPVSYGDTVSEAMSKAALVSASFGSSPYDSVFVKSFEGRLQEVRDAIDSATLA